MGLGRAQAQWRSIWGHLLRFGAGETTAGEILLRRKASYPWLGVSLRNTLEDSISASCQSGISSDRKATPRLPPETYAYWS
jgi:hypothetical protein